MTQVSYDKELVRQYVAQGSDAAFRALVGRHVDLVYGAALRQVGDAGIAEEVTQNVFGRRGQTIPWDSAEKPSITFCPLFLVSSPGSGPGSSPGSQARGQAVEMPRRACESESKDGHHV